MNRRDRILQHVDAAGRGIEIGPSHNPLAPKRDGFNVVTIDTLDRAGLRQKYSAPSHQVDVEPIEEVDYVWSGERYSVLVPPPHAFDWILASHVIEHTPDIIAFLNDCGDVLGPRGVLSLAIPDKRYCFDHFRPRTALAHVIDSHVAQATRHTAGSIAEYMLNAVSRDGKIAWSSQSTGQFTFLCSLEQVRAHLNEALAKPSGIDVHAWCFTPSSFRLLIRDLNALGLITLREVSFHDTDGSEFYVTLGRHGDPLDNVRLGLLEQVEAEGA